MSGDLKVTTAHVRELSARQSESAAQIGSAAAPPAGTGAHILINHGLVCATTAAMVTAAEAARTAACAGMASVSTSLGEKLSVAATKYDEVDSAQAGNLGAQMHPN